MVSLLDYEYLSLPFVKSMRKAPSRGSVYTVDRTDDSLGLQVLVLTFSCEVLSVFVLSPEETSCVVCKCISS